MYISVYIHANAYVYIYTYRHIHIYILPYGLAGPEKGFWSIYHIEVAGGHDQWPGCTRVFLFAVCAHRAQVCTYACTCGSICVLCVCIRTGTHVDAYMYQCRLSYTHTHKQTYIHTYIHACMHTCMYAYMHVCIHACMHTCILYRAFNSNTKLCIH